MFPTGMFETQTQRQILRVLAEKNRQYTLDELAEACHRSRSTVSRSLNDSDRYPFVRRSKVPNSKQHVYSLDPESEYSTAIRDFFDVERRRERHDGTVPVDVWNLLEDLTGRLLSEVESFVELFLFGSYATGEYYAGSDIDLLLIVADSRENDKSKARAVVDGIDPEFEVQLVVESMPEVVVESSDFPAKIREVGPMRTTDTMIPLSGRVEKI